jgi:CheY-like chemotaxis protein
MQILYIEDDPTDARLVDRYVKQTPHQLTIVTNIADAKNVINSQLDLIMVDVMLGHTRDGYSLIRDLREEGWELPIIAVTALTMPKEIEECYALGCNDVLAKPYTIDQLENIITKYA